MGEILKLADLRAITGYDRAGDVERCLREQGIKVFRGKGGAPWTTIDLVNAAGGFRPATNTESAPYSSDDFK